MVFVGVVNEDTSLIWGNQAYSVTMTQPNKAGFNIGKCKIMHFRNKEGVSHTLDGGLYPGKQ